MHVSMRMKFLLFYSSSMSVRLLVEEEVQLLWATYYNLQQGLMKSHLLDLNCNLVFNLFQQLKSSNGHLFLQEMPVVRLCFNKGFP